MTPIRVFLITVILAYSPRFVLGAEDHGPLLAVEFSGSSNDPGWIFKLDTTAGYRFNDHLQLEGGLPVYLVRLPEAAAADSGNSKSGIGNAYIEFKYMLSRPRLYYSSAIRGTAPTGDADQGFSTGRATFDWNNYLEYRVGKLIPFGSAGLANTVSDTHFFNRPFTSLGLVAHFEGGLTFEPADWISFAGSGYAVSPSGQQKIYSKIVQRSSELSSNSGKGNGRIRPFQSTSETVGTEDITKDHGLSGWINLVPASSIGLELGYSRSISYDLNSIFFSVRVDLGTMLRKNSH